MSGERRYRVAVVGATGAVGTVMRQKLRERGFPAERAHVVRNLDEATARLHGMLGPGDVVLFENDLPDQYESPGR